MKPPAWKTVCASERTHGQHLAQRPSVGSLQHDRYPNAEGQSSASTFFSIEYKRFHLHSMGRTQHAKRSCGKAAGSRTCSLRGCAASGGRLALALQPTPSGREASLAWDRGGHTSGCSPSKKPIWGFGGGELVGLECRGLLHPRGEKASTEKSDQSRPGDTSPCPAEQDPFKSAGMWRVLDAAFQWERFPGLIRGAARELSPTPMQVPQEAESKARLQTHFLILLSL